MKKSVTAAVKDPGGMIAWLRVAHESDDVVIVYGEMNARGKRAKIMSVTGETFILESDPDRGWPEAVITLNGLPADAMEIQAEVSRYSLYIVFVTRPALARGREVYCR